MIDLKTKYLKIYGVLDQHQGDQIYQSVFNNVCRGRTTFIIDLAHVPLVDNSGLSFLIVAMKAARNAGGDLYLTAVSRPALKFLKSKYLDNLFKCTDRSLALCTVNS